MCGESESGSIRIECVVGADRSYRRLVAKPVSLCRGDSRWRSHAKTPKDCSFIRLSQMASADGLWIDQCHLNIV